MPKILNLNLNKLFSGNVRFLDEAVDDLLEIDGSIRNQVVKAINKVSLNPLPSTEGGFGKPLGNKNGVDLTGFNKIKFKKFGIRCVYKYTIDEDAGMLVVVISCRKDDIVYKEAFRRIKNNDL